MVLGLHHDKRKAGGDDDMEIRKAPQEGLGLWEVLLISSSDCASTRSRFAMTEISLL